MLKGTSIGLMIANPLSYLKKDRPTPMSDWCIVGFLQTTSPYRRWCSVYFSRMIGYGKEDKLPNFE
jgi:hypothetical protein